MGCSLEGSKAVRQACWTLLFITVAVEAFALAILRNTAVEVRFAAIIIVKEKIAPRVADIVFQIAGALVTRAP
jgi:hypothetical protein